MAKYLGGLFVFFLAIGMLALAFLTPAAGGYESGEVLPSVDPLFERRNEEGDSGAVLYGRYCSGCHGVHGDGKGPAARFLTPKPRDFTQGLYKFTSTPAGSPPLDEDLLRTITYGLHGTSMPAWRLLSMDARVSLVDYVKSFFKEWDPELTEPEIPFVENPFFMTEVDDLEDAIEKGRIVYHKDAACWGCHPAYLVAADLKKMVGHIRPDLSKAIAKVDAWGELIPPPDFRQDRLKSVRELKDLYRVIVAGVGGTAMPTWKGALTAEQFWSLTIYVDSLRPNSIVRKRIETLQKGDAR